MRILLILFCDTIFFLIVGCNSSLLENLTSDEIMSSGYRYLIFGSQTTNGVQLYDFRSKRFVSLLVPGNKSVRYMEPVVGKSGKGFCIKEENTFDFERKKNEIIVFDLNTLESRSIRTILKQRYSNLALSPDETKLALIFISSTNASPLLGIFNVVEESMGQTFPVDKRFIENPITILWKPDSRGVVIWDSITGLPAVEIDALTGHSKMVEDYPLDYKNGYMLVMGKESKNLFIHNLGTNKRHLLKIKHRTAHALTLSRDGKYLIYGWLRGKGFETLTIMEVQSGKRFQIKMDNHPSTILGLTLW